MQKLKRQCPPQKLMNFWIIFTLLAFTIGPIKYGECEKWRAVIFIIIFLLCANIFYDYGSRIKIRHRRAKPLFTESQVVRYSVRYGATITLLTLLETVQTYGLPKFSVFNIFAMMAHSYTSPNEYMFMVSRWILSYTSWIRMMGLVLGSAKWKELRKWDKMLYILMVALIVVQNTMYVGSQKEIIDLFVFTLLPLIMNWYRKGGNLSKKQIILLGVCGFGALLFMGTVIQTRRELWHSMFQASTRQNIDTNNFFYKMLPDSQAYAIVSIMSYLTQGYRGLALCLTLPFVWTFGMGSSFKLMNDVSRWFSIPLELLERSYPVRMEEVYGVGAYSSWHSIFPWIASDVTFVGAIIIVSLGIYYWAKSWCEFIKEYSWPSIVAFCQLTIFVLYIPCNNQLLQTRESIISTTLIAMLWFLHHGYSGSQKAEIKSMDEHMI